MKQKITNIFKRGMLTVVGVGALAACATTVPSPAQAQSGADIPIMVMMEDKDPKMISASSSVAKYMMTKIKEQFSRYNYYVVDLDAVAATLRWDTSGRRDKQTLFKMGIAAKQSGKPEFDVRGLVVFYAYPEIRDEKFAKIVDLEIAGEIHDADGNRFIGDFGPQKITFSISPDCNSERCISEAAREKAAKIASIVADEARKKLAKLTKTGGGFAKRIMPGGGGSGTGLVTTYNIQFENFTMDQVFKAKRIMETEFPHRIGTGKILGTTPIINYAYKSTARQDKIFEWLNILLADDLGLSTDGDVQMLMNGSKFTLKRLGSDIPQRQPPKPGGRFLD